MVGLGLLLIPARSRVRILLSIPEKCHFYQIDEQGNFWHRLRQKIRMSKTDKASPRGSPLAVAVMFIGNGLVMASSLSRIPGIPRPGWGHSHFVGLRTGLRRNRLDRFDAIYRTAGGPVFLDGGQPRLDGHLPWCLGAGPPRGFGADVGADHVCCRFGHGSREMWP